jgi:hypothetical protein
MTRTAWALQTACTVIAMQGGGTGAGAQHGGGGREAGLRIHPQPLIYDYCATSLQAVHDYVTSVSGRSSGLVPRL